MTTMWRPKPKRHRSGQTILEFALVSIFFIFLLVVTYNAVVGFSVHQYFSYVVFQSARSFQASRESPQRQQSAALETLQSFIPALNQTGSGLDIPVVFESFRRLPVATIRAAVIPVAQEWDYGDYGPGELTASGIPARSVALEFDVPFVTLPIGDLGEGLEVIRMRAASFLGRENTQFECRSFFDYFLESFSFQSMGVSGAPGDVQSRNRDFARQFSWAMEDNGC